MSRGRNTDVSRFGHSLRALLSGFLALLCLLDLEPPNLCNQAWPESLTVLLSGQTPMRIGIINLTGTVGMHSETGVVHNTTDNKT